MALPPSPAEKRAAAADNSSAGAEKTSGSQAPEAPPEPDSAERLLSRMRHDLRTPISAILGYSELLAEDVVGEVSDAQRDMARRIGVCALELDQMVDALVTMMRVRLDFLPGARTRVRAGNLALLAVEHYASRPGAQEVRVEVRSDRELTTDARSASELLEALLVCLGLHAPSGSVLLAVEDAGSEARFRFLPASPLREGFWEESGGRIAAEVAHSLAVALGGSVTLRDGEIAAELGLPH
jgi:signal transduction histidine kinase